MRTAGILMPVSMLNGGYGIGDFGQSAYQFIDIIAEIGFSLWQILPLNPVGYGNSPYQPYSSYAGDEIYLDLESLYNDGLLSHKPRALKQSHKIDYDDVRTYKNKYLKQAFKNFAAGDDFVKFSQNDVIYNYAVFATFKKAFPETSWNNWQVQYRDWIKNKEVDLSVYQTEIDYQLFLQYIFYKQWLKLKTYANKKGIKIVGDIPIYVGYDSADVWQDQRSFLLNRQLKPSFVAGVPPDYFNKNGQRWGNPLYDWDYIAKDDFNYWLKRISYNATLYDIIRIDHFRAFDTYWKIKASNKTARKGEWVEAPGYDLFAKIFWQMPEVEILAEDLGDLRKEVHELRDDFNLMGMNIMQFTFNPSELAENYNKKKHIAIYTGTHDNQTIKGYYQSQTAKRQKQISDLLEKCGASSKEIERAYLEVMFYNIADYAIVPVQDVLGLGDESRINSPGTVGEHNWTYKLTTLDDLKEQTDWLQKLIVDSKR